MGAMIIMNWEMPQDVPQINNYHFLYGIYYMSDYLSSKHFAFDNLSSPPITL